jgi:protein SCO1/2
MKRLKKSIFLLLFSVIILSGLLGCGQEESIPDALNWEVENFTYHNQDGNEVGLANLQGKIWIADFIFTNCTTVCSPMTSRLASIQNELEKEGLEVSIVSFTVDPERDDPKVLKEFGQRFDVNFNDWHFLTGYTQEEIQQFSLNSFKSPIQKEPDTDQFMHVTSFFLIDQSGMIVKRYSGLEKESSVELINDVRILAK